MLELKNRLWSIVCILALGCPGAVGVAHADTQAGVDFLVGAQQADGSVVGESVIASGFQSTAESLRALDFVIDSHALDSGAAVAYLDSATDLSTESRARSLILAARAGSDTAALLTGLLQHQNADGGFADYPGASSTVLDTAFALEALGVSGFQSTAVSAAVSFLLSRQGASGGWRDGSNAPSVYLSALAMRALWQQRSMFAGVAPALAGAQQFLLAERDPASGLWAEVHESALALLAIIPNVAELAEVEALIEDLGQLQLPDGSWDREAFTTALALRALESRPTVPPPLVTTGSVSGRVINAATGTPIGGAQVEIDALSLAATTAADGSFSIADLDAGSYSLDLVAGGYAGVGFASIEVRAGVNNSLGEIRLTPLPTTGVLQGRVSDRQSGDPVAGATIGLSGANDVSLTSSADGLFSIVGLNPGTVSITVTRAGYAPISANADIAAGGTLVFNPGLIPLETSSEAEPNVPVTGTIRGTVTEAVGAAPIAQAVVRVYDAGSGVSLAYRTTDASGNYEIQDLNPGEIRIEIGKPGYLTVEAFARVYAGNAIVFSPGLVVEGADPGDATGTEAGLEPLPGTGVEGSIGGVAIDEATSLPLAGVTISVSGAASASTSTAADGSYRIAGLPAGEVQINATLDNYFEVVATGSVVAGNNLVFNPAMIPRGFAGDAAGSIVGRVIETSSGNPLRFVLVTAVGSGGETSGSTRSGGDFELTDLDPGNYRVRFERLGYVSRSFDIVVSSGATIDLGIVELDQVLTQVAVFGAVTDSDSGAPIEAAVVSILGSTLSTQTDAGGNYRLDDIGTGSKSLLISATGYRSKTFLFNFPGNGEYRLDYDLARSSATDLGITFFGTDRLDYPAYAPVVIEASVSNNGNPVQARVVFSLFDADDRLLSEFSGTEAGSTETDILFDTGAITSLAAGFDTRNLPPGQYRLLARVLAGNPLAGPATVILDERATVFSVTDSRRVARLIAEALPNSSAVGTSETLTIRVTALNRSNVNTSISFRYELVDPVGGVLYRSPSTSLPLPPEDDTVIVELDPVEIEFEAAGDHQVRLVGSFGLRAEATENGLISVAPGLRIEPSQSATPGQVTPDENKRIRIDIRLQGMEVER